MFHHPKRGMMTIAIGFLNSSTPMMKNFVREKLSPKLRLLADKQDSKLIVDTKKWKMVMVVSRLHVAEQHISQRRRVRPTMKRRNGHQRATQLQRKIGRKL
jgi:hypothetical protein